VNATGDELQDYNFNPASYIIIGSITMTVVLFCIIFLICLRRYKVDSKDHLGLRKEMIVKLIVGALWQLLFSILNFKSPFISMFHPAARYLNPDLIFCLSLAFLLLFSTTGTYIRALLFERVYKRQIALIEREQEEKGVTPEQVFDQVWENLSKRKRFGKYLESCFAVENFMFLITLDKLYQKKHRRKLTPQLVYDQFIRPGVINEVNLDHKVRTTLTIAYQKNELAAEHFADARQSIRHLLCSSLFPAFLVTLKE
jgi:hypothetical protein